MVKYRRHSPPLLLCTACFWAASAATQHLQFATGSMQNHSERIQANPFPAVQQRSPSQEGAQIHALQLQPNTLPTALLSALSMIRESLYPAGAFFPEPPSFRLRIQLVYKSYKHRIKLA